MIIFISYSSIDRLAAFELFRRLQDKPYNVWLDFFDIKPAELLDKELEENVNKADIVFERWSELQPKSYSRDPVIKEEARNEMNIVRKDLCQQLNAILDYLYTLHKNLSDHYNVFASYVPNKQLQKII